MYLLPLLLGISLLLSCQSYSEKIKVDIEKPTLPVLTMKGFNPTIKLNLIRNDNIPYILNEIDLSFAGTTDIKDIESVAVYGADKEGLMDTSVLVYKNKPVSEKLTFKEDFPVDKDTLSLWVSVTLKRIVDMDHRIQVNCTAIKTDDGVLKIEQSKENNPLRVGVAVRQYKQDGVFMSRIPGIVTTKKGTLLAIFDARYKSKGDLQGDIDIGLTRSTDKGQTWEPMQIVLDMGEWGGLPQRLNGVSDPCILVDENTNEVYVAGLWMYGLLDDNGKFIEGLATKNTKGLHQHQWKKRGSQPGFDVKQSSQFIIAKSTDDGVTWSEPVNITSMVKKKEWWLYAPAPGHGITLTDGTIVFPTQGRDSEGKSFSNIMWSKDHGKSWTASNPAYSPKVSESMAAQLSDGSIMLNMRDPRNRNNTKVNGRRVCVTSDLGETWTEHPTSRKALIEPTCMASLHKHEYTENGEKKSFLLFLNPSDHAVRHKMTLKVSFDDGETWPEDKWILLDDYKGFGYSCITSVDENTIGLLYETSQANLTFQHIKLDEIIKQ